jgi:hypothetical protein
MVISRINPPETKENIHFRSISILRTESGVFIFRFTTRVFCQRRDTREAPPKKWAPQSFFSDIKVCTITLFRQSIFTSTLSLGLQRINEWRGDVESKVNTMLDALGRTRKAEVYGGSCTCEVIVHTSGLDYTAPSQYFPSCTHSEGFAKIGRDDHCSVRGTFQNAIGH